MDFIIITDVRHEPLRGIRSIATVLVIVFIVCFITLLSSFLMSVLPFIQWVGYGLVILLALYVMRRYVWEYRYKMDDQVFTVERLIGERNKPLVVLRLDSIESYGEERSMVQSTKRHRFLLTEYKGPEKIMVYRQDKKLISLRLQPSQEMDKALTEAVVAKRKRK